MIFAATGVTIGEAAPEPTEQIEVRWVPFDEALAMTLDGRHHRRDVVDRDPAAGAGASPHRGQR